MQESGQSRTVIDVFGGYNHNDRIKYGEFFDINIKRKFALQRHFLAQFNFTKLFGNFSFCFA